MRLYAFVCLLATSLATAQTVTTPRQGAPVRTAILNALRKPVEKELGQRVVFQVDTLRVKGEWAFMSGRPLTSKGKKIDYRKTPYRAALDSGAFDDWICALLKKNGTQWKVLRYAIGATDVVWDGWDREFKAPRAIFPYGLRQ